MSRTKILIATVGAVATGAGAAIYSAVATAAPAVAALHPLVLYHM